jgi:hypothetical protein
MSGPELMRAIEELYRATEKNDIPASVAATALECDMDGFRQELATHSKGSCSSRCPKKENRAKD